MEADEQENMTALQAGLERAARQEEEAIEAHRDYVPNTEIGAEAQAQAYLAHQGARAEVEAQAGEAHQAAKRQHHKDYAQAMKDANAWRASIVASIDRAKTAERAAWEDSGGHRERAERGRHPKEGWQ